MLSSADVHSIDCVAVMLWGLLFSHWSLLHAKKPCTMNYTPAPELYSTDSESILPEDRFMNGDLESNNNLKNIFTVMFLHGCRCMCATVHVWSQMTILRSQFPTPMEDLGVELLSSCLQVKCFPQRAISQVPTIFMEYLLHSTFGKSIIIIYKANDIIWSEYSYYFNEA